MVDGERIIAEKEVLVNIIEDSYKVTRLGSHNNITDAIQQEEFKKDLIAGVDKLFKLRNKYRGRSAIVMGLGPSLLETNKEEHRDSIKIVCNDFWRVPSFFDDFKPDFWGGANSHEALHKSFGQCLDENISTLVTVPLKKEFFQLLKIPKIKDKMDLVIPWFWEKQIFQIALANKFGADSTYSTCNTVTNHLTAFALWLGCESIYITGFDLSYGAALKNTGMTHAGFTETAIQNDAESGTITMPLFDVPQERQMPITDLSYLCTLAVSENISIYNLSHQHNGLPHNLTKAISPAN